MPDRRTIGIAPSVGYVVAASSTSGRMRVVRDPAGRHRLPTSVAARADGRFITGLPALNLAGLAPFQAILDGHDLLGLTPEDARRSNLLELSCHSASETDDGILELKLGKASFSPEQIVAHSLRIARTVSALDIGHEVRDAVIAVPSAWGQNQRDSLMKAAELADLDVAQLVNQPVAAALAHDDSLKDAETIMVVIAERGDADITILQKDGDYYEAVSTNRRAESRRRSLGFCLAELMLNNVFGDVKFSGELLHRMLPVAERVAADLHDGDTTKYLVPWDIDDGEPETEHLHSITLGDVQRIYDSYANRTLASCEDATSNLSSDQGGLDHVIIAGDELHVSAIVEPLRRKFGKAKVIADRFDTAIAIGAAKIAHSLYDSRPIALPSGLKPQGIIDKVPAPISVETVGGLCETVVTASAHLPATVMRRYVTSHDNQTRVRIQLYEGDARMAEDNVQIGELVLTGIPPARRGATELEVTFRIDKSGILDVSARENVSRKNCDARLVLKRTV